MPEQWTLQSGARPQPDNSVHFAVWAPRAQSPRVRILTGPARGDHALAASDTIAGFWEATVANVGINADYAFVLEDNGRELPDPVSRWQPRGVHGPSRVVDPAFTWSDAAWRGASTDALVIYELHVGTFTAEGTFGAVIPRLPHLASLGVTAIELMPVGQCPGERNWGYDGVGLYAAQHSYGGPVELKRLVDAAHAHGLAVILDVVYNHVGPEGNYLDLFGPYFTEKYKTPWGRALNYDDAHSDPVRRFVIDNALYWVCEYHIDGLRLDAVHGIFDFGATHLLQELAAEVHQQAQLLGKSVVVIGESDLNDPRLIRPVHEHGFGLDAQWSDDFHHAVHAALSRETVGYYADFGSVSAIAAALREPFVYDGRYSAHRRRRHGAPSAGIPRNRFVVAIQNHDQVGNRATGDRLSAVLTPAQQRVAAALLLLSPYVPLLFMGEEYGEMNPFLYFVDHSDEPLISAVREGRRREFESFGWGADVPDPYADSTFQSSKLDWSRLALPQHAQMLTLYRDLLAVRRDEPLMRSGGSKTTVSDGAPGWITLLREPLHDSSMTSQRLLSMFNCSDEAVTVPVAGSATLTWVQRLSTDAIAYGGKGELAGAVPVIGAGAEEPRRLMGGGRSVSLPPWTAVLFEAY